MVLCSSSIRTIGRVWLSATVPKTAFDHAPDADRTSSTVNGAVEAVCAVLIAAYTRPTLSVLRLRWSSVLSGPPYAVSVALQVVSDCPSTWKAKWNAWSTWLLQSTPILLPPNAMIDEMSSISTLPVEPEEGRTNGVPQVRSLPVVRLMKIWLSCAQLAQSLPVESFAMTSASIWKLLIWTGKPASSVYCFVLEL